MSLRAGDLRHRVRIDRKVETPTGSGGIDVSWEPLKSVWARMVPLSGREYLTAAQLQDQILVRATVRAGQGTEPTMRLVFRGLIYNITAILPDPTWNEYETLMLSEGTSDG